MPVELMTKTFPDVQNNGSQSDSSIDNDLELSIDMTDYALLSGTHDIALSDDTLQSSSFNSETEIPVTNQITTATYDVENIHLVQSKYFIVYILHSFICFGCLKSFRKMGIENIKISIQFQLHQNQIALIIHLLHQVQPRFHRMTVLKTTKII